MQNPNKKKEKKQGSSFHILSSNMDQVITDEMDEDIMSTAARRAKLRRHLKGLE